LFPVFLVLASQAPLTIISQWRIIGWRDNKTVKKGQAATTDKRGRQLENRHGMTQPDSRGGAAAK
jgi:hypothetical protein